MAPTVVAGNRGAKLTARQPEPHSQRTEHVARDCPASTVLRSIVVDPEYVETQPTRDPHFDEAGPHPSSPAGQVQMWGAASRRVGPSAIRAVILCALLGVSLLLLIEVFG